VLSENGISEVKGLQTLVKLKKLALSNNKIRAIPSLEANFELQELRLNGNKIIKIPDTMRLNPRLKILDLGKNLIKDWSDVENLAQLPKLKSLTLAGNPLAAESDYRERVLSILPNLKILDGKQISNEVVRKRKAWAARWLANHKPGADQKEMDEPKDTKRADKKKMEEPPTSLQPARGEKRKKEEEANKGSKRLKAEQLEARPPNTQKNKRPVNKFDQRMKELSANRKNQIHQEAEEEEEVEEVEKDEIERKLDEQMQLVTGNSGLIEVIKPVAKQEKRSSKKKKSKGKSENTIASKEAEHIVEFLSLAQEPQVGLGVGNAWE